MIIVRIIGGLGNQMFQYAYAKALQRRGFDVTIDISKFNTYKLHGGYHLDKFKIDLKTSSSISTFLSLIKIKKNIKEKSLLFDDNLINLKGNEFVKGYFQTEKYFLEIRDVLIDQFTLQKDHFDSTLLFSKEIKSHPNSCSVHIRRGDYISDKNANSVHGICDLNYYNKAINLINEKYENIHFFVFSDDIEWTKKNLKINKTTYIEHICIPHEDMFLMSLCKHNIIANSSFSWWGAWLNQNKKKTVVAPKKWFVNKENEVASKDWKKL